MDLASKTSENELVNISDFTQFSGSLTLDLLVKILQVRFNKQNIYSYCGNILIALNPYQILNIFTSEWVKKYSNFEVGNHLSKLPPHVFSIARNAFSSLIEERKNQSILISGESGAGKTETSKLILQFLTSMTESQSQIQQMLLEAGPILEAFGNSKTTRNNNSSRFGKFTGVFFSEIDNSIIGATIIQYLLEQSRIVHQAKNERNYHVFYYLCKGSNEQEKKLWYLTKAENFHYLNQGNCFDIENVDDDEEFEQLRAALNIFFSSSEEFSIFQILAAILQLGEVKFKKLQGDAVTVETSKLNQICQLLALSNPESIASILIEKNMEIKGQKMKIRFTQEQAVNARDSLAKSLYTQLFDWIVYRINSKLSNQASSFFIGILDIFGFENFKHNSFEQLCINYTNEKLQQKFNQLIFDNEQKEYKQEGIEWENISFPDNRDCLDLIEKKPLCILSILDEECKFPKATDASFLKKLDSNFEKHPNYETSKLSKNTFTITHFAGKVSYQVDQFLEKNKAHIPQELVQLIQASNDPMISSLVQTSDLLRKRSDSIVSFSTLRGTKIDTVGSQFKSQLNDLMEMLNQTNISFIRCIKPNSSNNFKLFDTDLIREQLRYLGMVETIRIRQHGYAARFSFIEFENRYRVIDKKKLQNINFQKGKTKIFLKQEQFNELEKERKIKLNHYATIIQKTWKMYLIRQYYLYLKKSTIKLQALTKGWSKRRIYAKKYNAVITLQSFTRMLNQKKKYQIIKEKRKKEQEQIRFEKESLLIEQEKLQKEKLERETQQTILEENTSKLEMEETKFTTSSNEVLQQTPQSSPFSSPDSKGDTSISFTFSKNPSPPISPTRKLRAETLPLNVHDEPFVRKPSFPRSNLRTAVHREKRIDFVSSLTDPPIPSKTKISFDSISVDHVELKPTNQSFDNNSQRKTGGLRRRKFSISMSSLPTSKSSSTLLPPSLEPDSVFFCNYRINTVGERLILMSEGKLLVGFPVPPILQSVDESYSYHIDTFAKNNFQKRERGFLKKGIVPLDELLVFSKSKLKRSLLTLKGEEEKLALEVWNNILAYQGLIPSKLPPNKIITNILSIGIVKHQLRNEIYCQLARQLTANPFPNIMHKTWELLALCCSSFSPNQLLIKYIASFIMPPLTHREGDNIWAKYCIERLSATIHYGCRNCVPCSLEIEAILNRTTIPIKIYFPDSSSVIVNVFPETIVAEVLMNTIASVGISHSVYCALYESCSKLERTIGDEENVGDILFRWESWSKYINLTSQDFKFLLKRRLWLPDSQQEIANELEIQFMFEQTRQAIHNTNIWKCKEEERILILTSILFAYQGIDPNQLTDETFFQECQKLIPQQIPFFKHFEWHTVIKSKYIQYSSLSVRMLQIEYLEEAKKISTFGSFVCVASHNSTWDLPKSFELLLNSFGIQFYTMDGKLVKSIPINFLSNWLSTESTFSIRIAEKTALTKNLQFRELEIKTLMGEELVDLLDFYSAADRPVIQRRANKELRFTKTPSIEDVKSLQELFEKGIFRKKPGSSDIQINHYLSFQATSILESLLPIENSEMNKLACKLFFLILQYCGITSESNTAELQDAQEILSFGIENETLRDEIYLQLWKQTLQCPDILTLSKIWELLTFVVFSFPPSSTLYPYIEKFIKEHTADDTVIGHFALEALNQFRKKVKRIRSKPLSKREITCIKEHQLLSLEVGCGGAILKKTLNVDPLTTVEEFVNKLTKHVGLQNENSYFLFLIEDSEIQTLSKETIIGDVIYNLERKYGTNFGLPKYLQFRKIMNFEGNIPVSSFELQVEYHQACSNILADNYSIDLFVAYELTAFQNIIQEKRISLNPENLNQFLPESLLSTMKLESKKEFIKIVIKKQLSFSGISSIGALSEFVKRIRQLPLYGFQFFLVKQKRRKPSKVLIAVHSTKGVLILEPKTTIKTPIFEFQWNDIKSWREERNDFIIVAGSLVKPIKLVFESKNSLGIKNMFELFRDLRSANSRQSNQPKNNLNNQTKNPIIRSRSIYQSFNFENTSKNNTPIIKRRENSRDSKFKFEDMETKES